MNLCNRGSTHRHGIDHAEHFADRLAKTRLDLPGNRREIDGRQAVLQEQQIARCLNADQIRPRRQRLPKLDRRRADGLKGAAIVGLFRLERAKPREAEQAAHGRRCAIAFLDQPQRAVPRERAAPAQ